MSLNWKISNVKDNDALFVKGKDPFTGQEGEFLNSKTDALIWFTMVAGLRSEITEDSAPDWYARIALYEKVCGVWCYREGEDGKPEPDPFTPEDIVRNIGLWTNGNFGKKETWAQYVKRITQTNEADAKRRFADATSKVAVA